MASSGSFNTTAYSTDYGNACLTFSWSIKSQDATTNQTIINWSVTGAGLQTGHYIKAGGFKVVINGQTVYSKSTDYRIELYTGTVVASGTATITHNTDGSKTFSASVEAGIYYYAVNCSGSGSWALTTIPRYATASQSKNSMTETTIKMNWSSDSTIDYIWYSKDNGSNWTGLDVTDGKSGTYTISGLSANTDYKIKTRVRRKDSQLTTDSSALTIRTYDYPHCIEAPSFVIGESVSLGFYNPLGRTFTFNIIANAVQLTPTWSVSGTSYYGLDEESVQTELYNSIPDKVSASYYVRVTYGDSVRNYAVFDGYQVDPAKCAPTDFSIVYGDDNQDTFNITGNDQVFVKGYSELWAQIGVGEGAEAQNGATMLSYAFRVDSLSQIVPYSTGDIDVNLGDITSAGKKRLTVTAYDSRSLATTVFEDITVYDYEKPVINADIKRLNNFEAETTLKISGTYHLLTIDGEDKNYITKVEYRYRETGGTWSDLLPLTTTLMSGTFTCNDVVLSLDNSKSFEIEIQATDRLDTTTLTTTVDIGQAIFFISTNKKACYINGVEVPTLETLYPVGSVFCNSTNTNPSEIYGGTWELIDKGFKSGTTAVSQAVTGYLTKLEVRSIRSGNTIRFRMSLATATAITDTGASLGTVDLTSHGLKEDDTGYFPYHVYGGVAMSDGSNAVIMVTFLSSGEIQIADGFQFDGTHSIPANTPFYFDVVLPVYPSQMLDEFCDKFYFKRTA